MIQIPEAAVEAAARSLYRGQSTYDEVEGVITGHEPWEWMEPAYQDALRDEARELLEAAAPHMLREAWFEGFNTGMEYGEWWAGSSCTAPEPDNSNSNPYGGRA